MKNSFKLILTICVLALAPAYAIASEDSHGGGHGAYPESQVERPLTMPTGMGIIGAMVIYEQTDESLEGHADSGGSTHLSNGDSESDETFDETSFGIEARYGITDELEVFWLGKIGPGVKYAVYRDPGHLDVVLSAGLKDYGDGDETGSSSVSFGALEVKWFNSESFALKVKAEGISGSFDHGDSVSDAILSIAPMLAVNEHVAVELIGQYHMLDGYDKDNSTGFGGKLYINGYGHPSLEFVLAAKATDYPPLTIDRHVHENATVEAEFVVAWLF